MRDLLGKLRSTRVRAILALGVFFLFASAGTLAYWTAQANVPGATFQTGNFDLKINGVSDNLEVPAFTNLAPNQSIAFGFTLKNAGSTGLNWTARATSSGELSGRLAYQLYVGATATSDGKCVGGVPTRTDPVVLPSNGDQVDLTPDIEHKNLAVNATISACVRALLDNQPNSPQVQSAKPVFTFDAKQDSK